MKRRKRILIVAEIGINHNGDLKTAQRLMTAARKAGCDAVKFQKKNVEAVYRKEALDRKQKSPFGTTFRDLKLGLEFSQKEYEAVDAHSRKLRIPWFASCWDRESVDFLARFRPPFYKIPSACLQDDGLLRYTASRKVPLILSTGLSNENEIAHAVRVAGRERIACLLHCTCAYPSVPENIHLAYIPRLKEKFGLSVGYSSHNPEAVFCTAAAALGAAMIEFHLTLDRSLWGADQASSLEVAEAARLVKDIRLIEQALGNGSKEICRAGLAKFKKLAGFSASGGAAKMSGRP